MDYLIVAFVLATVMIIIIMVAAGRYQRERHRVELQKAILERVGSVKDFAEFMTTEQGERFLAALAPSHFRPHHRGLWSVRVGVVLLTIGVFLMIALHTPWLGTVGDTPPPALFMGLLLLIAAGTGMLLSAAVSFVLARALGVNGRGGSKKDGAA